MTLGYKLATMYGKRGPAESMVAEGIDPATALRAALDEAKAEIEAGTRASLIGARPNPAGDPGPIQPGPNDLPVRIPW